MNQFSKWIVAAASCGLCASAAMAETFEVTLDGASFLYDGMSNMDIDLEIDIGDTVRWVWVSGFHNVVSGFPGEPGEGDLFNSGPPVSGVGTVFENTFVDTGIVGYHCEVHEGIGMISQVTVVPSPASMGLLAPAGLVAMRRRRR